MTATLFDDTDSASVDLYWLPLGSGVGFGSACVRWNGRAYEALVARRAHRPPCALYHSALLVTLARRLFAIEMAPVWGNPPGDRGAVLEGPVGHRLLGRSRFFRYEVRCWPGGEIPDAGEAVASPVRVAASADVAQRVLDLVPQFPVATWGRDEWATGDMCNSNSLIAWLLAQAGCSDGVLPPPGGRAPGWNAGLPVAGRQAASRTTSPSSAITR